MTFNEHYLRGGAIAIEGAIQFVRISRGSAVSERRVPATFHLEPGSYLVESWTQTCSANCGNLDPPALACKRRIRAPARVVVVTRDERRCSLRAAR